MSWEDSPESGLHPNLAKFLGFLGKAEGADYNTIVGGSSFNDFTRHPAKVGLRTKEGPSTAAGRYQITKTTYDDVAPKIGITDFSQKSQDLLAAELIRRGGALEDVLGGNYENAIKKLGGTWASLPSSPYSQPKRDWNFVKANLTASSGWEDAPEAAKAGGGWEDAPEAPAPTAVPKAAPQAPAKAATPVAAPQKPPTSRMDLLKQAAQGVGDTLTFGYLDELAGKAANLVGADGKAVTEALRQNAKDAGPAYMAGQLGGALVPGLGTIGAIRAIPTAGRLARMGAGAATGAIQGGVYGSGSAEEDKRIEGAVEGAATGAAFGGVLGGVLPTSVKQEAVRFKKRAGSDDIARIDQEVVRDLNDVYQREVRTVGGKPRPSMAIDANAVATRYVNEAKDALSKLDEKTVPNLEQIQFEIANRGSTPSVVLESLKQTTAGRAVVDAMLKADRVRTLTGQQLSTGGVVGAAARMGVEASPAIISASTGIPAYLPRGAIDSLTNKMGASVPRAKVLDKLLSPKQVKAAQMVGQELGESAPTQSMRELADLAARMQAARQATAPTSRVNDLAGLQETAAARRVLGLIGSPRSGAYNETLERTGLTNETAIPLLRKLSKDLKGTEIGKAATQLRRSQPVDNEGAFYDVQNIIRDLGAKPGALSSATTATLPKATDISRIVSDLPEEQVRAILNRNTDTMGEPIKKIRGYLTTAAKRAAKTYKETPDKLPAEDLAVLRALGIVQ